MGLCALHVAAEVNVLRGCAHFKRAVCLHMPEKTLLSLKTRHKRIRQSMLYLKFQNLDGKMRSTGLPIKAPCISQAVAEDSGDGDPSIGHVEGMLNNATSLYPVYVLLGGLVALVRPDTFSWFVKRGPTSYSLTLGGIMLAMGLTLQMNDLVDVILHRPFAVAFGCAAQYGIMPLMGLLFGRLLGLPPDLAAGLILLASCPGGTASNVVTYIAHGDVALSVMMTVCATFGAVLMTPFLTSLLAGTFVPVDATGLAVSTLQVVVLPVLLGAWLQSSFPQAVARVALLSPLAAVLMSSLLACSVFSANIPLFLSISSNQALPAGSPSLLGRVVAAVLLVHTAGFLLGYTVSAVGRFREPQRRAISIEVGMQNSSLGVVLATKHFASPSAALPAALSAVMMNIMGSSLAAIWRQMGPPSDPPARLKASE